jgi:hypothetical protein
MVLVVAISSILLSVGLGKDLYMVKVRSTPVKPAIRTAIEKPVTAPKVPKPKITNATIKAVLAID